MPSKWIQVESAQTPAREVARKALTDRVGYVQQMLPLAALHYREDVEHVHQVRVGCRRAGAALDAFRPLMSKKPKSLKRWLRKIRRAAGPARDMDVLLARFFKEPADSPAREFLLRRLEAQRKSVQRDLVKVEAQCRKNKLSCGVESAIASLKKSNTAEEAVSFQQFSLAALQKASQPLLEWGRSKETSKDQLHQLRIACKRLRYSIEIFHCAFPAELRETIYPQLVEVQDRLGELNDHATAQALFQQWLSEMPPDENAAQLAKRIVLEHEAADCVRNDFLNWWSPERIHSIETFVGEHCSSQD